MKSSPVPPSVTAEEYLLTDGTVSRPSTSFLLVFDNPAGQISKLVISCRVLTLYAGRRSYKIQISCGMSGAGLFAYRFCLQCFSHGSS